MRIYPTVIFGTAIIGVTLFLIPRWVQGQSDRDCAPDRLLIKETEQHRDRTESRLIILNTMTVDDFENAKKDASLGATLLVDGVPIKAFGNYKQFKEAVHRETRMYRLSFTNQRWTESARTYLSEKGAAAYVECPRLKAEARGTHLFVTEAMPGSKNVIVTVKWVGGPDPGQTSHVKPPSVTGGKILSGEFPKPWR